MALINLNKITSRDKKQEESSVGLAVQDIEHSSSTTPSEMNVRENSNGVREFSSGTSNNVAIKSNMRLTNKLTDETASSPVVGTDISNNLEQKIRDIKDLNLVDAPRNLQAAETDQSVVNLTLKKYEFADIIKEAISLNASDIHLTVGYRAVVRIDGSLKSINTNVISPEDMSEIVKELLKIRNDLKIEDVKELDLSYNVMSRRLRVNIFRQKGNFSIVARIIPETIRSIDELELPQILKEFTKINSGLILITGPAGSGKSTTIASILNNINLNQPKHIITLEDPIEFVFPRGQCLIDQREFGVDFESWNTSLRYILRQDPDIVFVGEMRDYETIASTMTISETGHLVFATLHTNSAAQTVDRIIDVFPNTQQAQIRAQLANVITAVVSQRLVPLARGGRRAVLEIMIATPAIRTAIREGKTHMIDNMIRTGQDYGMNSMENSLIDLIEKGLVSIDTAKAYSVHPDEIDSLLVRK